jgi:hypothetical protein
MSTEPRRVVLWKSKCPPSYEPIPSGACLRKTKPAAPDMPKPQTAEERKAEIHDLLRRLIAGAQALFNDGAGSALDASHQAIESLRGAEIMRRLAALGYDIAPKDLAGAVVAASR